MGLFDHLKGHSPAHEAEAIAKAAEGVVEEVVADVEKVTESKAARPASK